MLRRTLYNKKKKKKSIAWNVFTELLYKARFEDGKATIGKYKIDIKVGECIVSRRELAKKLNVTPGQIQNALKQLIDYKLINMITTTHGTVIKIKREFFWYE